MDHPASTSVRYTAPGAPVIEVAWVGFEQLGLWSKAGGDFLCIEPWYGFCPRSISTATSRTSQVFCISRRASSAR